MLYYILRGDFSMKRSPGYNSINSKICINYSASSYKLKEKISYILLKYKYLTKQ